MLDKIGTPSYMAPELWMEDDKKYAHPYPDPP